MIYVNTDKWGEGTVNLFFEGWVFDARKNYPCENVTAMDESIGAACEGYAILGGASAAATTMAFGMYDATESPPDRWAIGSLIGNDGDLHDPGGYSYSFPTDAQLVWNFYPHARPGFGGYQWRGYWRGSGPGGIPPAYKFGCAGEYEPGAQGAFLFAKLWTQFQGVAFSAPKYVTSDEILEATCDVSLKEGYLNEYELHWDGTNLTEETVKTKQFNVTVFGAWVQVAGEKEDGEYPFTIGRIWGSGVDLSELREYDIGGTKYLRGTVDCTQLLKDMIDGLSSVPDNAQIAFIVAPEGATGEFFEDGTPRGLMEWAYNGYVSEWDHSWAGGPGDETFNLATKCLVAEKLEILNFRFRPNAEALKDAAKYHFGSEGRARVPDLGHVIDGIVP